MITKLHVHLCMCKLTDHSVEALQSSQSDNDHPTVTVISSDDRPCSGIESEISQCWFFVAP